MVVTKVGFDQEAESPKLTFKPVGFLDDEGFAEVQEMIGSDLVQNILGASVVPTAIERAAAEEEADDALSGKPPVAAKAKAAPVEEAKPAPKAKAKPAPVEEEVDLDLDGISFDD
jgi:hypothetical protein